MDNRHVYCNISDDFSYLSHGCVLSRSQVQLFATHHVLQPARLLCLWDFPGKDTEVGCHFLLPGIEYTSSDPGIKPENDPGIFCIGRWILYHWVTWEALVTFACTANYQHGSAGWFHMGSFPAVRRWQELASSEGIFSPSFTTSARHWDQVVIAWPSLSFHAVSSQGDPGST